MVGLYTAGVLSTEPCEERGNPVFLEHPYVRCLTAADIKCQFFAFKAGLFKVDFEFFYVHLLKLTGGEQSQDVPDVGNIVHVPAKVDVY